MMLKVSGFPELLPEEKIVEEKILSSIKNKYQQFGYTLIETPAVERNEVLLAKGGNEVSKQIFGLYGLAQGCEDKKPYSLHFDLTVPFARYAIDYFDKLTFPFKRSQIQKVWRGERAQKGRYREFYQADIDVIWDTKNKENYLFFDAEVIFVIFSALKEVFERLDLDEKFTVHVNNKKILEGLVEFLRLDSEQKKYLLESFDKFYKISQEEFENELNKFLNSQQLELVKSFLKANLNTLELFVDNDLFQQGVFELKELFKLLDLFGISKNVSFDPYIVRGLDYYTGLVFETFLEKDFGLGSIASGGRYENFTKFLSDKIILSGVGGSIGVSRLESYIFEKVSLSGKTSTEYLFINFSQTYDEIFKLYLDFLKEGKNCEIYPIPTKLKKQFKYADKKGIPYCVVLGEEELENNVYIIKDMKTGNEIKIRKKAG